jgi:hypothetical protein
MRYVERVAEAAWEQGQTAKQPRRVWAVEAVRPEIEEEEWAAAIRAVRETSACFEGQRRVFDSDLVQGGHSDHGLAAKVSAARRLALLKQCAMIDTRHIIAARVVEGIVQMHTMSEIAAALGRVRRMGDGRDPIPDSRQVRPLVKDCLTAMAAHYAKIAAPHEWRKDGSFGPVEVVR